MGRIPLTVANDTQPHAKGFYLLLPISQDKLLLHHPLRERLSLGIHTVGQ